MDSEVYAKLFQALANEIRMELIEALQDGSKSVSELVEATDREQNTVSYHLRCLTNCGFAEREVRGNKRIYTLNSVILDDLFSTIETHIDNHRQGIYTCEILEGEQ
ncbi:MAG: metalloregulator ArsR/SmtB family transcription factor [Halobacteria archaeon]|nr:metalloregulator ArsR/SmtB family transcription factor [Halobacteria archaeon]